MLSERRTIGLRRTAVAAGYVLLAIVITWPLVTSPFRHVTRGWESVATVPALNVWTVWWNADRAQAGFRDYWHAPIFHPARYAFAFSEAQPTTLTVAPLVALCGPVTAYNVYLLAVLTLNGLTAYRLLTRIGLAFVPCLLGGALVEMLPIVQWQLGVLQLTTICGVVWLIDRLVALRDGEMAAMPPNSSDISKPEGAGADSAAPIGTTVGGLRWIDAVLLGVAAALCYTACNYFGLFLSALLPISFLPLVWGRWLQWRFWALLALAAIVAVGLCAPILRAQFAAKSQYEWSREERLLYRLSAQPRDYFNPYRSPLVEGPDLRDPRRPLWTLGTGPFMVALAGLGVAAGLCRRGRRRWTLFLLLFGVVAFVLSLGLSWEITDELDLRLRRTEYDPVSGWLPYRWLTAMHPGLALARSPFRFAFFVHLAAALLAAIALDAAWNGSRRLAHHWKPLLRRNVVACASLGVVAAGGYAAVEIVPTRQPLYDLPSLDQTWIRWLAEHSPPNQAIVCLPFPMGANVDDYERTALFMVEQIGHRRPMVDGYSGFFPPSFLEMKSLMENFPDEVVIDELRARDVGLIVSADADWTALAERTSSLDLAFHDQDANVSIFKVLPKVAPEGFFP